MLIDTTGKIQTPEQADALSLLTQTQLYIRLPENAPMVYNLADFGDFILNQKIAGEMMAGLKRLIAPTYYVVIYLGSLVLFIFITLLLGVMACLFARMQKKTLSYMAGMRLTVVALTPAMVIGGLLAWVDQTISVLLYVLLALAYLYIGAGSARRAQPSELYLDDECIGD
jgi:hypothetical protein